MLVYFYYVRDTLRTAGAPGRTRTDTGRILSPLSLPLDYGGVRANLRVITRKSHICADKSEDEQKALLSECAKCVSIEKRW